MKDTTDETEGPGKKTERSKNVWSIGAPITVPRKQADRFRRWLRKG